MSDYIKRDDVMSVLGQSKTLTDGMRSVLWIPSADAVEVKHGKWSHDYIKDGMEYSDWFNLHCSVCGQMQFSTFGKWNYCPNCGAKMDEEEQENE